MEGAPQITNTNGSLTAMLDAVLANGFGVRTATGISFSAGIATITFAATHKYSLNQVVEVSSVPQAEYNGQFNVIGKTTFTISYYVNGTPPAPTGTPSVKIPSLNFEIAFTGTNKRAYRSKNILSSRLYLRVDDSLDPVYNTAYAKKGKVSVIESMSDIDTITGAQAPYDPANITKNHIGTGTGATAIDGWYKWYYAKTQNTGTYPSDVDGTSSGNRSWVIVGDDRGFYLFISCDDVNGGRTGYCFTDFESFRQGDAYSTILTATDWYALANSTTPNGYASNCADFNTKFAASLDFTGKVIMKDYQQVGSNVRAGFMGLGSQNGQVVSGLNTGVVYPNGPDYGLIVHPTYLKQENNHIRGKMPGMMWVHNDQPLQHFEFVDGILGYPGRKFLVITTTHFTGTAYENNGNINKARIVFDVTGPWY